MTPIHVRGLFDTMEEETEASTQEKKSQDEFQEAIKKRIEDLDREEVKIDYSSKKIKKITAGNNFILVLYQTGELFWVSLDKEDITEVRGFQIQELKNKIINDIEADCFHCVALEKEEIPPISEWTTEKLMQWFESIDFPQASNLAKYNKMTGETIASADDDFFEETLGL